MKFGCHALVQIPPFIMLFINSQGFGIRTEVEPGQRVGGPPSPPPPPPNPRHDKDKEEDDDDTLDSDDDRGDGHRPGPGRSPCPLL
jgi:hypothetical protein